MTAGRQLRGLWLGRRPYEAVHALQLELHEARQGGSISDTVLFLEHETVITLGRAAKQQHLLAGSEQLAELGISVVVTGRGGDVTLHAPGQLVCYPIVDLDPDRRDVRRYVADLSRCMQGLVKRHGIDAGTHGAYVGLWADAACPSRWPGAEHAQLPVKIGAIGVRISRWITMHGFALNLSTNMDLYRLIVPCGISTLGVASVASLTGRAPSVREAAEGAWCLLGETLNAEQPLSPLQEYAGDLRVACL